MNVMSVRSVLGLFAASWALWASGCSSSGDITSLIPTAPSVGSNQAGLVSGATQNYVSPQGYRVSASLGAWNSNTVQTTAKGYTVYASLQGSVGSNLQGSTGSSQVSQ